MTSRDGCHGTRPLPVPVYTSLQVHHEYRYIERECISHSSILGINSLLSSHEELKGYLTFDTEFTGFADSDALVEERQSELRWNVGVGLTAE